jgi:transcriptional regulator with XRE-family HTH domain
MISENLIEKELRQLRAEMVGEFLKEVRESAGFTQHDIAEKLSYSTAQFVSNWERGISLPPLDVLRVFSKICNVPCSKLIDVVYDYQQEALRLEKKRVLATVSKTPLRVARR